MTFPFFPQALTKNENLCPAFLRPKIACLAQIQPMVSRVKKLLQPYLSLWAKRLKRKVQYACHELALQYQRYTHPVLYRHDPLRTPKTIWVRPEDIQYRCLNEFSIYELDGTVIGGDWDHRRTEFENLRSGFMESAIAHFHKGTPWEETRYYQFILNEISQGRHPWGCETEEDIHQHLKNIEDLYESIRLKGYQPHGDHDEVGINIGREGTLLFNNGRHRLTFAKMLNIPKIPVRVNVRHALWHQFKWRIWHYMQRNGGKVYAPLLHPDLEHVPSLHGHDRFEIIAPHIPPGSKTLLDIGAHWGYFCHRFEEMGLRCTAVENDPEAIYFLQKLRDASHKTFTVAPISIFDFVRQENSFDVVLALNVFHHFLKARDDYDRLINLLQTLRTRVLFFEPHLPQEPQMRDAYRNFQPDEFARFVAHAGGFSHITQLGTSADGRILYRLSQSG